MILKKQNNSITIGRQEWVYDNSRILGNVGWAQQARSHDAILFSNQNTGTRFDIGLAYNQSSEKITGNNLYPNNTYKALQFIWFQKKWEKTQWSLLFLNNGLQDKASDNSGNEKTYYSQTLGSYGKFTFGKWNLYAEAYWQTGKDGVNNDLNAFLLGGEGHYAFNPKFLLIGGFEHLSGNDQGKPSGNKNKAFTPFYGTNHKFNGFMDYFYVGNHANSVGLTDVYLKTQFKFNPKATYSINLHHFSAAAAIPNHSDKNLGMELDLVYSRSIYKDVKITAGYSHFFPEQGLKTLQGNTDNQSNDWAWLMLTVNPVIFKTHNQSKN